MAGFSQSVLPTTSVGLCDRKFSKKTYKASFSSECKSTSSILSILLMFAACVWFMSTKLQSHLDHKAFNQNSSNELLLRTVKIMNRFPHDILVYFENGESGEYLTSMAPEELTMIRFSLVTTYSAHGVF